MCLISVHPPGVPVNQDDLMRGEEVNAGGDEGSGWAVVHDGRLWYNRATHSTLDEFVRFRAELPDSWGVYHTRLSTGTPVSLLNSHPVPVGKDLRTRLFHNGTLFESTGFHSDTRQYAGRGMDIDADFDNPEAFAVVDNYMHLKRNKAVVVTSNPLYKEPVYIFDRSQWLVTPQGVMHSNPDYLGKGKGWDETEIDGQLYRWRLIQPGQCKSCQRYGCHGGDGCECYDRITPDHPAFEISVRSCMEDSHLSRDVVTRMLAEKDIHCHPAWRNETQRRARVAAAQ